MHYSTQYSTYYSIQYRLQYTVYTTVHNLLVLGRGLKSHTFTDMLRDNESGSIW